MILVTTSLISSTIDVLCVIGLNVSPHTIVLLPIVFTLYNLACMVTLSCGAVAHYLISFIAIMLDIAMSITTTNRPMEFKHVATKDSNANSGGSTCKFNPLG